MDENRRRLHEELLERADRRARGTLDATILRSRSLETRELLAFQATGGRLSVDEIVQWCRATPDRGMPLSDPDALVRLAKIMALSEITEHDLENSLLLFSWAEQNSKSGGFQDSAELLVYLQTLFTQGFYGEVTTRLERYGLAPNDALQLRSDLSNPTVCGVNEAEWLQSFTQLMGLVERGFEPLELTGEDAPLFDQLHAMPNEVVSGPLVTIAVIVSRPDRRILTALRSLTNQTWNDLDILVIDSGSGIAYRQLFSEAENLDPRIRVVTLASNGGRYRALNVALDLANGEYFTVHRSVNWAHPRRIEYSVRPMLVKQSVVATKGHCIRASDDLVVNRPGHRPIRRYTPSLTFRRATVVGTVGYYDEVRHLADAEFEARIEASFTNPITIVKAPPLTVHRIGDRHSSGDAPSGSKHWAHYAYKSAYTEWHQRIVKKQESPFLPRPDDTRPFSAPRSFQAPTPHLTRYDVVYVSDWRHLGATRFSMFAEIDALRSAGLSVGICHLEAHRYMRRTDKGLHPVVQRKVNQGEFDQLMLDDEVTVDLVIVRYPPVLQFPQTHLEVCWQVEALWIVANLPPAELDGTDRSYLVSDCTDHARTMFRKEPLWVPQGPKVRESLTNEMDEAQLGLLAPFDDPSILDLDEWRQEHRPAERSPIRIGRFSRDHPMKFPATLDALRVAYPSDDDLDIRMLGAAQTVETLLGGQSPPDNWIVLPFGSVHVKDFLKEIDFFVYYDHPARNEAFGRAMLEAMAGGVVVILDPKYEETFGDAALYSRPEEAASLVRRLHSNPDEYQAQIERAHSIVEAEYSPQAFLDRVTPFVPRLRGEVSEPDAERPVLAGLVQEGPRLEYLLTETAARVRHNPAGWLAQRVGQLTLHTGPETPLELHEIPDRSPLRLPTVIALIGGASGPEIPPLAESGQPGGIGAAIERYGSEEAIRRLLELDGEFAVVVQDGRYTLVKPCRGKAHWLLTPRGLMVSPDRETIVRSTNQSVNGKSESLERGDSLKPAEPQILTLDANHLLEVDGLARTGVEHSIEAGYSKLIGMLTRSRP